MKKNLSLILTLILAFALVLSACSKEETPDAGLEQQIQALQAENAELKNQIEVLTQQLGTLQTAVLKDWSLKALASSDRTSATITFMGIPATLMDGDSAIFVVTLNGLEAESVPCNLEEGRYSATVELPAADGYGYHCLLISANGSQQNIPLSTAETGGNQDLVNLGTSLNAYCTLFVENWDAQDGKLIIRSGFAFAQMGTISTGGDPETAVKAELVFLHNGKELERKELLLEDGEAVGAYEMVISDISFTLPAMENEHQLDLQYVVTLSSGSTIRYDGCSWHMMDGVLNSVMG